VTAPRDRRARQLLLLAAWYAGFLLLGYAVWSLQAGSLMVIGYVAASVVLYVIRALFTRCPNCRMPVLLRPQKVLGMELYTWSLFAPSACRHCGEPLK
jgi:hypothetical protein